MIALSLLLASQRWGDGSSPYNYSTQAEDILNRILFYEVTEDNYLFFCPGNSDFFDLSYQMPAFYRYFAIRTGNTRWDEIAENSYQLLNNCLKTSYGNTENGLVPDYCNKDGSLRSSGQNFSYEAMRFPFHVAVDKIWFDPEGSADYLDKIIGFFGPIYDSFGDEYELDGTQLSGNHSNSWVGSLSGGAMGCSSDTYKVNFFNHLMSCTLDTGTYRYYNICWYNFGILLASGNFKIW
jgi:oligosaccharide reducing-end xylanase